MATLQESLKAVQELRGLNPQLSDLNDQELADLFHRESGNSVFQPAAQSSAMGRGVAKVGEKFSEWGGDVESLIADENSPFWQKVAGRTAGQLVASAPELAMTAGAGATKGLGRLAGYAGLGAFSYGRTKAETGSDKAALGSAAGSVLSALGGIKGAEVGRRMAGGVGAKGFFGGTVGSAAGGVPGDALEIGTSPGGFDAFLDDPVNLPAYALGNVGVGAAIDLAVEGASSRAQQAQQVKAETPELDSIIQKNIEDELVSLRKKPVAELTELDIARRKELFKSLNELQERTVASRLAKPAAPADVNNLPEAPVTIRAQKYLLHEGKKDVIEIPKGTELPVSDPYSYEQLAAQYTSPINGNLYEYNDKKVTPAIIDSAIKSNTLGTLLGYGTPGVPANPSGEIAVLRNRLGHEKAAVILGDGNEKSVLAALQEMALGTDVVKIEKPERVAAWRQRHAGLVDLKSLAGDDSVTPDVSAEIGFTNKILDLFEQGVKGSERKGPRFQLDQAGMINGIGLLKAVKQWAPMEMWEYYKSRGIETLLGANKVPAGEFTKWIRENTPEVEVKKLEPASPDNKAKNLARMSHELDTLLPDWRDVDSKELPNDLRKKVEDYYYAESQSDEGFDTDAATGRYGVEPKSLDQMPGAVDILINDPKASFEDSHFGDSGKGTLVHLRGYEEVLPTGEKAFHVFELQGTVAQRRAQTIASKLAEPSATGGVNEQAVSYLQKTNHPLLASYETLGLKAGIQYARSIGARYIAISDAETAMMTEGHDRQPVGTPDTLGLLGEPAPAVLPRIPQEPGMRAAYDDRLPTIAKKLTGDRGERVDFGIHKAVNVDGHAPNGGSPAFNNKTNITARLYDITRPSPELTRLFSLYDLDKQNTFDATIAKEMAARETRAPEEFTPEQMLQRAVEKGDRRVDLDAITNFVSAIKGVRGALREGTILNPRTFAVMDVSTRDVTFNRNITLAVDEATSKLAHEFTHGAILDLKSLDPAAYDYAISLVDEMGPVGRLAVLTELKKTYNLNEKFDPDYLAGNRFDPSDKFLKEKTMHEFIGGIMEAYGKVHADKHSAPEFLRYLPQPLQKIIAAVVRQLKSLFRAEMPNLSETLNPAQSYRLNSLVDAMQKHVIAVEDANLRAFLNLKKTSIFDESGLVSSLPDYQQNMEKSTERMTGELGSFAKDLKDATIGKLTKAVDRKYQDLFFSALFRTRTVPWTADHFWNLHGFRPALQSENFGYMAYLGQDATGKLSQEQALERWGSYFDKTLSNPSSTEGAKVRKALGDIIEENTNRRESITKTGEPISWKQMVSKQDMVSKYGLTEEQAGYADRIIRLPEVVIKEQQRKNELIDATSLAKMFFRANKQQDLQGVVQKVMRLNLIANEFGAKRYELDSYQKALAGQKSSAQPDQDLQLYLEENVNRLKQEEAAYKVLLDQALRQEFTGAIPIKNGPDSFVTAAGEIMTRMASARWVDRFMTQDAGYAPMTRRGRFFMRVIEKSDLGPEHNRVVASKGFDSEKEMRAYMLKEGLTDSDVEILDKETLKDRARFYSPNRMKEIGDRNKEQLGQLVEEIQNKTADLPPDQRTLLVDTLQGLMHDFGRSVQDELSDVIAVKGDKFKERRWLVPGFDKEDFLPNIFEYMDYKSVANNKRLTKARGELQLERPELDADPELRQRMEQELNYTLSNQTEYNLFRKGIFYFYLGASHRHIIQNAVQMPLNGVSQMVAGGTGLVASYKNFGKAAALAVKYNSKGTTGDKVIDILLKQAEKDGLSFQAALEAPVHEGVELQNALDSLNAQREGTIAAGAKLRYAGTRLWKGFEKFLMSTSSAAEAANRKTTFIASVFADRAKGVTDPAQLYKNASEFTNYVNFVGDKPNRPGYLIKEGGRPMHGPLVLWSALQSFTLNHISQLYAFHKLAKTGSKSDQKAFYTGVAHLLAFAGSMGLVGAATAEALLEEVTGVSLKTALRKGLLTVLPFEDGTVDRISDTILGGLPALAGVDTSNSIGLGSPLFRYQAGQPLGIEQFGGAGVGMLGRVGQAFGQMTSDPFNPQQWWKATRSAAPAFLSNFLRVADVMGAGTVLDRNQQPVSDPLGVAGSTSAALGFTPTQVSKQREVNSHIYKSSKKSAEQYQERTRNIAQEISRFQQTGDPEALLHANNLFSGYLDSVGQLQDRNAMVQSISDQLTEFSGRVTQPPTLKEAASRRRIEGAYPSVKSRYPSNVSSLLQEIEVMMLMGQGDLLEKKLDSLSSSLPDAALTDLLTQAGLQPEDVSLALQPSRAERLGGSPVR